MYDSSWLFRPRKRSRFSVLETYGFDADFRRKDLVGQFELVPSSVGKISLQVKANGFDCLE